MTTAPVPLAIDLYCGLGGWTDGLLAAGWRVIGFDIVRHVYAAREESAESAVKVSGITFCGYGEPGYKGVAFNGTAEKRLGAKTGGTVQYPGQLILQDALTIHGSQFRNADLIVASPPCQNYSYLAMPWSRSADPNNSQAAKALRKKWETEGPDNRLFDACFRIQREAIHATGHSVTCPDCDGCGDTDEYESCQPCAGNGYLWIGTRHIPLIVENVRGAAPWVGPAKAKFGSFYLWGDVAQIGDRVYAGSDLEDMRFGGGVAPESGELKGHGSTWFGIQNNGDTYDQRSVNPVSGQHKVPGFRFDGSGRSFQTASVESTGVKVPGQIQGKEYAMCRTGAEGQKVLGYSDPRRNGGKGVHLTSPAENEAGTKIGGDWFSDPNSTCRKHGSKSNARKAASAMIAKIPRALSDYVARVHFPSNVVI